MEEYYSQLNNLSQDLLMSARMGKIDACLFNEFYQLLNELRATLSGEEFISRKIAGLLFFVYVSLAAEAAHCSYTDELFIYVAKIQDILDEIFWDSPFKR